jgi:uncharacterized membrane protein HdeD (DUF308 family)
MNESEILAIMLIGVVIVGYGIFKLISYLNKEKDDVFTIHDDTD